MVSSEKKPELVPGVETIRGLVGEPPMRIEIPFKLQKSEEMARQEWNHCHIAIILYCYKCKKPLVWHTYPQDEILYHCPECKREWTRGQDWLKGEQK